MSADRPAFLRKFDRVLKRDGLGWHATCPNHPGGFPVLVMPGENRYMLTCVAEEDFCSENQLLRALGITDADLYFSPNGDRLKGLRTRGVILERVRPIRWLWARRIPLGAPSLVVGEEGVGKGTFCSWLIARATCGELEGDLAGEPANVLVIGDEDAFEPVWVPRLYAAGADLTKIRTLDDGEYLANLIEGAEHLSETVSRDGIGLLVFDQILDHVWGGTEGGAINNPKHVREAMAPVRRITAKHGIAALSLLHPIKGNVKTFRQLVSSSHQFNAVSRSSLMLAVDPEDESRRVLVRGKGNYSVPPRSFEFSICSGVVGLNGHSFEVPRVVDQREGEWTMRDLLNAVPNAPVRAALETQLRELLTDEEQSTADLARAIGRDPKDGSVRNALKALEMQGLALSPKRGKWRLPTEVQVQPINGFALSTSSGSALEGEAV